ncbi:glycosyltransferase [Crossiella cryophila]|uniref:Erythromycin biosynthesis protein CIII-like N-terminal domain-containing protein n=1 Tax=Crossiella cryophila TaxID=43355 RepID=A0A7W7FW62_9PSEU|nr:hypothetical protein [Crossiella cryophila]MBB4679268.1 hypothetical protein [Crossiella cryophila]
MRILFTFAGGNGHFDPLTPLAAAALAAGHTVAFASGPGLRAVVAAAGFTAFAVGSGSPDNAAAITALAPLDPERERRDLREGFARRLTGERLPGLLDLLAQWQPDVLVRDETDYAAAIAADRLGLPCASMTCMPAGGFATDAVVGGPLHEWRAAQGLPPDPGLDMLRHLVLTGLPLSFRDPADPLPATARAFRPLLPRPRTEVPDWVIPGRPGFYFTLGTIFNRESGDLFTRALAGSPRCRVRTARWSGSPHCAADVFNGEGNDPQGEGRADADPAIVSRTGHRRGTGRRHPRRDRRGRGPWRDRTAARAGTRTRRPPGCLRPQPGHRPDRGLPGRRAVPALLQLETAGLGRDPA